MSEEAKTRNIQNQEGRNNKVVVLKFKTRVVGRNKEHTESGDWNNVWGGDAEIQNSWVGGSETRNTN